MPACFSEQGGSRRRGGAFAPQLTGEIIMTYETKEQQKERFLAEFLQRVREAPPGTRVYMAVGDLFKDADVHNIEELRAARRGAVVRSDKDEREDSS
jgi:hypothetical protein